MTLLVLKALSEIKTNLKGCESKPIVRLLSKCKAGRNEPFSSGGAAAQQLQPSDWRWAPGPGAHPKDSLHPTHGSGPHFSPGATSPCPLCCSTASPQLLTAMAPRPGPVDVPGSWSCPDNELCFISQPEHNLPNSLQHLQHRKINSTSIFLSEMRVGTWHSHVKTLPVTHTSCPNTTLGVLDILQSDLWKEAY